MPTPKKTTKTKTPPPPPTVHQWKISAKRTFSPDPLDQIEDGDLIEVHIPKGKCFDIFVCIKVVKCGGSRRWRHHPFLARCPRFAPRFWALTWERRRPKTEPSQSSDPLLS